MIWSKESVIKTLDMNIIKFLGSSICFSFLHLQVSSSQYTLCSQLDYCVCFESYFKHKRETKAIMKDSEQ